MDASDYGDLADFFSGGEWNCMTDYEKQRNFNILSNYRAMLEFGLFPMKPEFMTNAERKMEEDNGVKEPKRSRTSSGDLDQTCRIPRKRRIKKEFMLLEDQVEPNCCRKSCRLASKSVSLLDLQEPSCCRQNRSSCKMLSFSSSPTDLEESICRKKRKYRRRKKTLSPGVQLYGNFCRIKRKYTRKIKTLSPEEQQSDENVCRKKRKYTRRNKTLSPAEKQVDASSHRQKRKYTRKNKTLSSEKQQQNESFIRKKRKYTKRNKTPEEKVLDKRHCRDRGKSTRRDKTSPPSEQWEECFCRKQKENSILNRNVFRKDDSETSPFRKSRTLHGDIPTENNLEITFRRQRKPTRKVSSEGNELEESYCRLTIKSKKLQNKLTFSENNLTEIQYKLNIKPKNDTPVFSTPGHQQERKYSSRINKSYKKDKSFISSGEEVSNKELKMFLGAEDEVKNHCRQTKPKKITSYFSSKEFPKEASCSNVSKSSKKQDTCPIDELNCCEPKRKYTKKSNAIIPTTELKDQMRSSKSNSSLHQQECELWKDWMATGSGDGLGNMSNSKQQRPCRKLSPSVKRKNACLEIGPEEQTTHEQLEKNLDQGFQGFCLQEYVGEDAGLAAIKQAISKLEEQALRSEKVPEQAQVLSTKRRATSVLGRYFAHGDGCFICDPKPHKRCHTWPNSSSKEKMGHRMCSVAVRNMVDKLHDYQGFVGRLHTARETVRSRWCAWRESRCQQESHGRSNFPLGLFSRKPPKQEQDNQEKDIDEFSHIHRKKTRGELVRISAAVMGIEFSYAAETAFVSPILLKIGVKHEHMTLVWALSPLVGFFVTPLLGSLSDRCHFRWGRRRPFILLLSVGILLGLLLIPNGETIGFALGDYYPSREHALNITDANSTSTSTEHPDAYYPHPWSVFFTVLGTVLLDFDADACQSPSRAYLLDVTLSEDHARGLSTFTIMAGLGGCLGYALGAINWDETTFGEMLGGHVRAVFTLITFIFAICVAFTITSFREIPLQLLEQPKAEEQTGGPPEVTEEARVVVEVPNTGTYGAVVSSENGVEIVDPYKTIDGHDAAGNGYVNYGYDESYHQQMTVAETSFSRPDMKDGAESPVGKPTATLLQYLVSILYMPSSLRILCITNLFCWSAHVCYSLYFTDFVGEAVFMGNPKADDGTPEKDLYEEGVRFGCWGMSMYSLSCAVYSLIVEFLIKKLKARTVYVAALLVDGLGMLMLAITKHRYAVIVFSATAGVLYSTMFTMPYLLVAHYHETGIFSSTKEGEVQQETQLRGLGTDIAIVSSMVFLAQFILSMCMGSLVTYFGTTTTIVYVAAILCFFAAISATQVMYLEL